MPGPGPQLPSSAVAFLNSTALSPGRVAGSGRAGSGLTALRSARSFLFWGLSKGNVSMCADQ